MSIINTVLLLCILGYVALKHNYLIGLVLTILLMVIEFVSNELNHAFFLVACEIVIVFLIVKETSRKDTVSPLVKYNPVYKDNILPKKIRMTILIIFILAFIIRLIDLLFPIRIK